MSEKQAVSFNKGVVLGLLNGGSSGIPLVSGVLCVLQ